MSLPDNPKPCMTCVHFRPVKRILWIIPVTLNHPMCAAVRNSQGQMEFTEIERSEWYKDHKNHCGPEAKFHQFNYPDNWHEP